MFICPIKYFTIYCFSQILEDNKYNTFIAEIESNNIFIFLKNIFKYDISHPLLHCKLKLKNKPGTNHVGAPLNVQKSKIFKISKGHFDQKFIKFTMPQNIRRDKIFHSNKSLIVSKKRLFTVAKRFFQAENIHQN